MSEKLPAPVMKIVLGHELERQRREAGLTQEEATQALGCSQQKIGYLERGGGTKEVELHALLDFYGVEEQDRAYAVDLHSETRRRAKRGGFRSRFQQHLRLLVDMEPTCQRYYSYRALLIPGVLQTEEYMRTLYRAWRPSLSKGQIDQAVRDRSLRQKILDNSAQRFWFILDEAALRRIAGNSEVMGEQLARLVAATERPNVELQVIPFSAGYYMGQSHDYTIFGYDTDPAVDIVYLEQHDGGDYVEDPERIAKYRTLWEQHKAVALGPEQTRRFLLEL